MKPISPPAVQHLARALPARRPWPNPLTWCKRQTWRFLIAYFLLRTAADFTPALMSYVANQAPTQAIERLTPFKPGSH